MNRKGKKTIEDVETSLGSNVPGKSETLTNVKQEETTLTRTVAVKNQTTKDGSIASTNGNVATQAVLTNEQVSRRNSILPVVPEPMRNSILPEPRRNSIVPPDEQLRRISIVPSSGQAEERRRSVVVMPEKSIVEQQTEPSSPSLSSLRKSSSLAMVGGAVAPTMTSIAKRASVSMQKGVSFETQLSPVDPAMDTSPTTSFNQASPYPLLSSVGGLEDHADAVENATFSEDGLLATAGGPDDGKVKVYTKGVGVVGPLRFTIDVGKDSGKADSGCVVSFCLDESRKTTLLLVGTRSERYLMGYKLSKSVAVAPLLVFTFPTKHSASLTGVTGFVPKEAANFFDPGVYFATCARGSRDVKLWNAKGVCLANVEADGWTASLRSSPKGNRLAVLSSGGGPGCFIECKRDTKGHYKFSKLSALGIDIVSAGAGQTSPSIGRRANNMEVYQSSQDVVFELDEGVKSAFCHADSTLTLAKSIDPSSAGAAWEFEMTANPEVFLQFTSFPPRVCLLIPDQFSRTAKLVLSKGKHVFFFDRQLNLMGVLEGKREDGDVVSVALSPKADFLLVCSFGGKTARVVNVI